MLKRRILRLSCGERLAGLPDFTCCQLAALHGHPLARCGGDVVLHIDNFALLDWGNCTFIIQVR